MIVGLGIGIMLAICGCGIMAWLARPPDAGDPPGAACPVQTRPALVNLVLTKCSPGTAAYHATILDLAGQGFLAVCGEHLLVELPPAVADPMDHGMTDYERQVLGDMRARLEDAGGARFEAVAEACTVDVHGTWEPFAERLRAAARRQGICRPLLPASGRAALQGCAVSAVIAAGAYLGARLDTGMGGHAVPSLIGLVVFWCGLGWLAKQDRLTAAGAALAARYKRERADLAGAPAAWAGLDPAALRRRGFALAAGVAEAAPGHPAAGGRRRRARGGASQPDGKQRPTQVWSSFSGSWRLVRIGSAERLGMGSGFAMLGGAVWLGLIAYAVSIPAGTGPLPLIVGAGALVLAVLGVRRLVLMSALPRIAAFEGQVIARWHEQSDSENSSGLVAYVAVDDGQRAWVFTGSDVFSQVALGDLARVTVSPRSRALIELRVTGHRRAESAIADPEPAQSPGPALGLEPGPDSEPEFDPLLTAAEATDAVGPVQHSSAIPTPGGRGVIHKGRDGTLSVVVAGGSIGDILIGRRGTPLEGVGDEAWRLNRGRTVIVRTGSRVAKLTLSGRGAAGLSGIPLDSLAATVADRLAGLAARP